MLNYIPEKRITCREILAHQYFSASLSHKSGVFAETATPSRDPTPSSPIRGKKTLLSRSSNLSRSIVEQFDSQTGRRGLPLGNSLPKPVAPQTTPSRAYSHHAPSHSHGGPSSPVPDHAAPSPIYQYKLGSDLSLRNSKYISSKRDQSTDPISLSKRSEAGPSANKSSEKKSSYVNLLNKLLTERKGYEGGEYKGRTNYDGNYLNYNLKLHNL